MAFRLLTIATVTVAAAIVILILIPVSFWRHPATDATYRGFDPNLLATSPSGPSDIPGKIDVAPNALAITAGPRSHPTVHLVTTPLSFSAAFDVTLNTLPTAGVPLRIGIWSPATRAGYFLIFDHDRGDTIRGEVISDGQSLQDLVGGVVRSDDLIAPFRTAHAYHIELNMDQLKRTLRVNVIGASEAAVRVVGPDQAPDLFNAFRPTLTVSAFPDDGSSTAVISNYKLTVPSQPTFAGEETVRIEDGRATTLVWVALLASVGLCLIGAVRWLAPRLKNLGKIGGLRIDSRRAPLILFVGSAAGAYVLANSLLFGVAAKHFEMVASGVWSYVAFKNGVADLYYRTLLAPAADAWRGTPVHEAAFSYGFTKAYYYLAAAWAYLPFSGPGQLMVRDFSFEVLLKTLNVLFGVVDAGLVYLVLKRLVGPKTAQGSALLFVLNPALILVMSVWGSTESVSLFFVLGSIWLAEMDKPLPAWGLLAAGAFSRPQILVIAFLLGAVYLRKFGLRRNTLAISWTVLVSFIVLAPFVLAISPSVPVDYVTRTLAYHIGNEQADTAYLGLSPANYSIWTLPLLVINGVQGLQRMWSPSTTPFIGSLTYGQAGGALSVGLLVVLGAVALLRRSVSTQPGQYLPILAFGMLWWMLVTPGAMSRYMIYPIATLILCRAAFSAGAYFAAVGALIVVASITTYGHLASDFLGYSGGANLLSPANNAVSHFVFSLFSADWFINLAALSNIAVLIALGSKAWHSLRGEPVPHVTASSAVATT